MAQIAGFPYLEVQFTMAGAVHDQAAVDQLLSFLDQGDTTDLFVVSHGWNNHMDEARELYRKLFASVSTALSSNAALRSRHFAVVAVLWPSKKFADKSLIAGGAAAGESMGDTVLKSQLEQLKGGFATPAADQALDRAKHLVSSLEDSVSARKEFVALVRSLVGGHESEVDVDKTSVKSFFEDDAEHLIQRISRPVPTAVPLVDADEGGAAAVDDEGGASGLIDVLGGIKDGALNLLNFATYYQMKERAGLVGRTGLYPLLRTVRSRHPHMKLHLIGHSFGGRLVTAAAAGDAAGGGPVADTMTLLQAAFSHHGFAKAFDGARDGFFRSVVANGKIAGPIMVTSSKHDSAVGKAYPLASMFAGQDAAGIGDKESLWGGIGCNGAQKTPEAVDGQLLDVGGAYTLSPRKVYNLNGDRFITGHSDICGRQVACAVLAAVAAS